MSDDGIHLIWILGVPDVVEEGAVHLALLGQCIWEVVLHLCLLHHLSIYVLHSNLVEEWGIDEVDILDLLQLLLPNQHILHESLCEELVWWEVVLEVLLEELHPVRLR